MEYKRKLHHLRTGFYQDRRTKVLNDIIDRVILPNTGGALLDFLVIRETGIWDYEIVVLTQRFHSQNVLYQEIYNLVEDLLVWYDISDFGNFRIRVVGGGGNNGDLTYFDLLGRVLHNYNGFRSGFNHTHRRYNQVVEYMNQKKKQEQYEYEKKMKLALSGGGLFYENIYKNTDPIVIHKPEKKSFVRKVKDYFLNLSL